MIFEKESSKSKLEEEAIKEICERLESEEILTNKTLIEICRKKGIELLEQNKEAHLIHEIFETAVNLYLAKLFCSKAFSERAEQTLEFLEKISITFPPQSWRGNEQIALQQLSTPPTIAFIMARILNPEPSEIAIEPSAGTGDLAVRLKIAGLTTIVVNEISENRREFLKIQGYEPFGINAEFLHDLLPPEIKPKVCLMNPPFSTSAGRTAHKDSNFGFRHISAALQRLEPDGKLVALVGTDAALKTDKGKKFWYEISAEYDIRAFINLPRRAYYKFGTSIQTCIVAIQKRQAEKSSVLKVDCRDLKDALDLSEKIFARK